MAIYNGNLNIYMTKVWQYLIEDGTPISVIVTATKIAYSQ